MSRPERTAVPREAARQFQAVGQAAAAPQDRGARRAETGAGEQDAAPRATGGGALPAAAVDASQRQPSAALGPRSFRRQPQPPDGTLEPVAQFHVERFQSLRAALGEGRVGLVHGQMPPAETRSNSAGVLAVSAMPTQK